MNLDGCWMYDIDYADKEPPGRYDSEEELLALAYVTQRRLRTQTAGLKGLIWRLVYLPSLIRDATIDHASGLGCYLKSGALPIASRTQVARMVTDEKPYARLRALEEEYHEPSHLILDHLADWLPAGKHFIYHDKKGDA